MPFSYPNNKKIKFSYFASYGLSYNFNPFDPAENPINVFIGSYRNVYARLGFRAVYSISEMTAILSTYGFKHFSNGASSLPNLGTNLFPFSLGVQYKFTREDDKDYSDIEIPEHQGRTAIQFSNSPTSTSGYVLEGCNFTIIFFQKAV
jgi:hypothetical protein